MQSINYKEIELASFRSWPAIEESEHDGVILRFSNGYSKRANSANVLQPPIARMDSLVNQCEAYFQHKAIPCVFRIPSFANNKNFDNYLESQGYQYLERSFVFCRSIDRLQYDRVEFGELAELNPVDWMRSYCAITNTRVDANLTHLSMLKRIEDKTLFAVLREQGKEVACGFGVISNGLFGLFDIVTLKSSRNTGYATKLIKGMLSWAAENGAKNTYLQVVADNQPAINLYLKLGYQPCYEYGYRIRN